MKTMFSKIFNEKGDSRLFFGLSVFNTVFYVAWFFAYVICLMLRDSAFNMAQTNMMISGYTTYTLQLTSPVFPVLKVLIMFLPLILGVWTVLLLINDRKNKTLCDKWLILTAFGVDVLCGIMALLDVSVLNMIF